MKVMIYVIRFEEKLGLGDVEIYLKEIESPIRLEVGDKIVLNHSSFDDDGTELDPDHRNEMLSFLIKKSIISSKYEATFEISDVIYNHHWYDPKEGNFHGVITLKGK